MPTPGTTSANGTKGTLNGDPSRALSGRPAPTSATTPPLALQAGVAAMGCATRVLRCSRCCS
eukprot:5876374-Lingulodinium_polyedra.AAC.1